MKASQWIDRLKVEKKLQSDYAAAKLLGVSPQAISKLRSSGSTLEEGTSIKVAELLRINPAGIIIDQVAERTKSPEVRSTLSREVERLCILCK